MDKTLKEEAIRELEQEIDRAVDILFVPKGSPGEILEPGKPMPETPPEKTEAPRAGGKSSSETDSSIMDLISKMGDQFGVSPEAPRETPTPAPASTVTPTPIPDLTLEMTLPPTKMEEKIQKPLPEPAHPRAPSQRVPPSIEKLETELLSLEWEITREALERARGEILPLQDAYAKDLEVLSVLDFMNQILTRMMSHGENIRPPLIKFLMDAKDTLKLLVRKDGEGEMSVYRKLAYGGIESRFRQLLDPQRPAARSAPAAAPPGKEDVGEDWSDRMEALSKKIEDYFSKVNARLRRLDEQLTVHETRSPLDAPKPVEKTGMPSSLLDVLVFRVGGRLLAVPSDTVFKLFRIPKGYGDRYVDQRKIQMKGFEARIVDVKKRLAIRGQGSEEEQRILMVHHGREVQGLLIERILKRVYAPSEEGGEGSSFASGVIPWNDQGHARRVPVLNLDKF